MGGHLNLFYPVWQGGDDTVPYEGGMQLKGELLAGQTYSEIEVPTDPPSAMKNDIRAYDDMLALLKKSSELVKEKDPDSIFTLGGSCEGDIAQICYLNKKYGGDLTVVWLDAHGDLNTPKSSSTKRFCGMPLRVMLGEGDAAFTQYADAPLDPGQLVMVGLRDLDAPEVDYIEQNDVMLVSADAANDDGGDSVIDAVYEKGAGNVFVHIDLDVLDPEQFPNIQMPTPNGLDCDVFLDILVRLVQNFRVVGLGLFEYKVLDERPVGFLEEIALLGLNLS